MLTDLRSFLAYLEASGELVRVVEELSPQYEIPIAIKFIARQRGMAVLFNRVKGYSVPIVGNLLGTQRRVAMAFGVDEAALPRAYETRRSQLVKPRLLNAAPVKEVVISKDIDILRTIPVLTHHENDAGPYMTTAMTIAKDPETGIRGMGLHRIQVRDRDTLGLFLATPPLSHFVTKADELGRPLDIAVAVGLDPLTYFTSCQAIPLGVDKFEVAGGFAQSPLELVKAESVDVEVPAHAEFVLEGQISPRQRVREGPFGETTGYYFTFDSPQAKIKVITHRRQPTYHALMPFGSEERALLNLSWETDTLALLRETLPFARGVSFHALGQMAIVQITKSSEEDAFKVIDYLLTNRSSKFVMVVDEDVDIADPGELEWALATRVRPDRDLVIKKELPGSMIDPSTSGGERDPHTSRMITRTAKMGVDATKPLHELDRYRKLDVSPEVKQRVLSILQKYLGQ